MCKLGIYIDFDNIWASVLDLVSEIKLKKESKENINKLERCFIDLIDKVIYEFNDENIKYIKAFSDFEKLPFSKQINIIDILHSKGIQTYIPYVRNNKDMSDRALIISAIKDIAIDKRNLDKIILLTGDIDYLPLFEFLSESTEVSFEIYSFKNRLSDGYKEVFYLKNKLELIDEILDIDSQKLEDSKKFKIFKGYLHEKKLDVITRELTDLKLTITNLNRKYYCNFEEQRIKKYIKRIKNEN